MSLTIYHLHFSQSDRIVWLCEELSALTPTFTYTLKTFPRGLPSSEGKRTLLSLHPAGTSPTMVDTLVSPPVTIAESQAILTYIINIHGKGRFDVAPDSVSAVEYANYLYWTSFANSSFQANLTANLTAASIFTTFGIDPGEGFTKDFVAAYFQSKVTNHLEQYDAQLSKTRYLASDEEVTGADFMNIFGLSTMRSIYPVDISAYQNIGRWLGDVTGRAGYRRMLEKAEDGMPPLIRGVPVQLGIEVMMGMKGWESVIDRNGEPIEQGVEGKGVEEGREEMMKEIQKAMEIEKEKEGRKEAE